MTFSVLQSVYRRDNPDFLAQSLQSIADNTLQPVNVILVKDGILTPELETVISEWQTKLPLKVVGYEQNQGLAQALNYGLQFVETDLVARMDSDDIWVENKVQVCMNVLKDNDFVVHAKKRINEIWRIPNCS